MKHYGIWIKAVKNAEGKVIQDGTWARYNAEIFCTGSKPHAQAQLTLWELAPAEVKEFK